MDIKDLPGVGRKFRATYSKPGQKSLRNSIIRLSLKNKGSYGNLSADNATTIAKSVKPYEKYIRLKGGLGRLQNKKIRRKLYGLYKNEPNKFSKEDYKDAQKIVKHLTKAGNIQEKEVEHNNIPRRITPRLDENQIQSPGVISAGAGNSGIVSMLGSRAGGAVAGGGVGGSAPVISVSDLSKGK